MREGERGMERGRWIEGGVQPVRVSRTDRLAPNRKTHIVHHAIKRRVCMCVRLNVCACTCIFTCVVGEETRRIPGHQLRMVIGYRDEM